MLKEANVLSVVKVPTKSTFQVKLEKEKEKKFQEKKKTTRVVKMRDFARQIAKDKLELKRSKEAAAEQAKKKRKGRSSSNERPSTSNAPVGPAPRKIRTSSSRKRF